MQTAKRRSGDDQNGQSGGPAGGTGRGDGVNLTIDQAKAIEDLYLRGGATRQVPATATPILVLRQIREAGFVETLAGPRGTTAKLTARGLSALPEASQIVERAAAAAAR